ncbi:MAG: hypothetical protein JO321_14780 [Solirubrobacterales bacterium]|nr:hypothetical protein [Solirubrobacterales bacterium]MBV9165348.1 hypothetical protein [Solirubrobacterales bacterium]MBV9536666.1 hypothetical protein [Solirubrobacterales bacterium]
MISFAASPPQETLPYGRWEETLGEHFRAACEQIDTEGEDLGEPGDVAWFPDRTYAGRTYVPAVARTTGGYELFGFVSFTASAPEEGASETGAPYDFDAHADFTAELAEENPDWKLDLNDEVIGTWRGEQANVADVTLVWGVPLIPGGAIVTAELANLAVDQCELVDDRFTLIAPDNYRQDFLEIKLWSKRGQELAAESLYVEDE